WKELPLKRSDSRFSRRSWPLPAARKPRASLMASARKSSPPGASGQPSDSTAPENAGHGQVRLYALKRFHGFGIARYQPQRLLPGRDGLLQPSIMLQGMAKLTVDRRGIRPELQRLLIGFGRRSVPLSAEGDHAEIVIGRGVLGILADQFLQGCLGFFRLASLEEEAAPGVQRLGTLGVLLHGLCEM